MSQPPEPEDHANLGLSSLGEIKKAMQRQEQRSRTCHCSGTFDVRKLPSRDPFVSPSADVSSPADFLSRKKPPEINTNLDPVCKSKSACGSGRKSRPDLAELLFSRDNEYTKALRRIESLKKTAEAGSRHTFSVVSRTEDRALPKSEESPAPQSVPSKDTARYQGNAFFAPSEEKKEALVSPLPEPALSPQSRTEAKDDGPRVRKHVSDIDALGTYLNSGAAETPVDKGPEASGAAEDTEELAESQPSETPEAALASYRQKLMLLSKEMRELKRETAREQADRAAEIEELTKQNQTEMTRLQEEARRRLADKDAENALIVSTLREELEEESKKASIGGSEPDTETIKREYEAKIEAMRAEYSEKEAATAVSTVP